MGWTSGTGECTLAAMNARTLDQLDTPSVLVDLDVVERNVRRMAELARSFGVALRPHCKTHKTLEIARMQREAGASGLTVAKLDEAEVYLDDGHDDVFVANEVVGPAKWARLAAMQRRGRVAVGVDDFAVAEAMAAVARREGVTIPVLVEVDCGLKRAGLAPGEAAAALGERIARLAGLELRGIFTHAGHAYGADDPIKVGPIALAEAAAVVETAELLRTRGVECPVVSVGSTPTVRISGAVDGVTEIRPGCYVFNDRMQVALGSAEPSDCALTVLASVISTPSADRAVVDAGSKTFALDRGAHGMDKLRGFGEDVSRGLVLERLSEEHGVLGQSGELKAGERLRFVPNHACTVANLARNLVGLRSGEPTEQLPVVVAGGGR
jgi:D-serine deaminase-like pyridoxal phosphate-dependent protein